MRNDNRLTRREAAGLVAGAAAGAVLAGAVQPEARAASGSLKHSVCKWCYEDMPLDDLARYAASFGMHSVELLDPADWPTVKAHGLTCSMANGPSGIPLGWNRIELHDDLVKKSEELLPLVAEAGLPNMILFSGNRDGMSDSYGLANCAKGVKRITKLAEDLGVTLCMELLNSKVNHKDYMCDRTPWGVELVKRVESDRFKLLYDIYHMQIMEGDVIATIKENIDYIGHFHTGGVPGRNEIDTSQELYYPAICKAIVETGFTGFIAQEFIPVHDPMKSLKQGVELCTV
jgi:hydroxypyruvate isomerase